MATTTSMTPTQQRAAELNASFTVVLYAKMHVAPRRALHVLSGSQITTATNTSCQECTRLRSLFRDSANGNYTAEGISRVARLHEVHLRMSAPRATDSTSNFQNEAGDKENAEVFHMENYEEGSEREGSIGSDDEESLW